MTARQLWQTNKTGEHATQLGVLVWDAPVRVFHWLMVLAFAGAWLTAEQDGWRMVHVTLGYTMAGLVAFRIVWGLAGSRHARFNDFVRGPASVLRYLRSLVHGRPEHHTGHNPAGAIAVVAMLLLTVAVAASGWATWYGYAGEAMEDVHEALATLMLVLVGFHVAAVLLSSWLHRENLVGAMINGRKHGASDEGIRGPRRGVALALLAAVLAFWWFQWQGPGVGHPPTGRAGAAAKAGAEHDVD